MSIRTIVQFTLSLKQFQGSLTVLLKRKLKFSQLQSLFEDITLIVLNMYEIFVTGHGVNINQSINQSLKLMQTKIISRSIDRIKTEAYMSNETAT